MNRGFLKRAMRALCLIGLLLASTTALALGLGEIRVLSQPGQPLVAEIPIISSEPGELEQLQARLASPSTFERVGLDRPVGLVSALGFAIAVNAEGRPVIRVTSEAPVEVDSVNFLVEVDWGQGRLVREYSALVSGPAALAAGGQPLIEAPQPVPGNTIVREPEAVATAPTPAAPGQPDPAGADRETETTAPRPAGLSAASPSANELQAAGDAIPVAQGQTLSEIAGGLGTAAGLDQTMIALLRANPEAFIDGNINLLKAGAVLRVPPAGAPQELDEREASALVRQQNAQWRNARAPVPQPAANPAAMAAAPAPPAGSAPPAVSQARLEIAPPAASAASRAGTQSGIDAEGEGDMLANQQLTATREDLAARQTEVEELRAQVAELETLQQQQAQLIAMKDSELAAAQQRLAQGQADAGQPLWLWAGLLLLVVGLVSAYLLARRKPAVATARRGYDSAAMAAVFNAGKPGAAQAEAPVAAPEATAAAYAPLPLAGNPVDAAVAADPPWVGKPVKPAWHGADSAAAAVAPLNPAPAGRERLELALAYIDLGDTRTARELLNEVVAGADPKASDEASQLLRELG